MGRSAAPPGEGTSTALIWRSPPLRLAILTVPLALTLTVLFFNVTATTKLIVGVALAVSVASPAHGLLLVALLAPLGQLMAPVVGMRDFRIGEAITLAFFTGWLLRDLPDRRGPRMTAVSVGCLFAAAVAASVAGLAWQMRRYPWELRAALDQLAHLYFFIIDPIGVVHGARLLEGLGLAAATITLFRRRPSLAVTLPAALAASATAAAAASVAIWMRTGGYRVSAHVRDINAAGSAFALALCLSLGMALHARGWRRGLWAGAVAAAWVGLWFSESRTAFAAAGIVVVVAAMWYAVARRTPRVRAVAIAAIFAAGVAVAALRVHQVSFGADYREQFYQTSIRMIEARPLMGIGIGQYYPTSALFLSPQLAWNYGMENAHNNFLQIGAELGLIGLSLFVVVIGAGLARTARALAFEPRDTRLLGAAAGVVTFVATWVGSHPLLVGETAFPFWILFGLMVALAGSVVLTRTTDGVPASPAARQRTPLIVAIGGAAMLAAMLVATSRPLVPPASREVDGFFDWERGSDGVRFRWSGQFASLFVPGDTTRVEIPVRVPAELRLLPRLEVDLVVGGVFQSRATVLGSWTTLVVTLPEAGPPERLRRIDMRVDRTWQPAIYIPGSADMRTVGIEVGTLRLDR